MPRRSAATLLLTLALASCGGPSPSPPASPPPSLAATATPGRPYDAATVLTAMRESRRPGGVPDRLETDEVAAAVASQVWTWDGQPWTTLSIGGACGPFSCTLDVVGSRDGAAASDLYSFAVARDGAVSLETADLHAYDAGLDPILDTTARATAGDQLAALTYVGARWLPPPDAGQYWLAYRSGGEEGAPGIDLLLDLASGQVLESRRV